MEYAVVLMSNMVNCKTNREDTAIAKAVAFALSKVDKMRIPVSEEHRRKISEALSGEKHPLFGMTGEKAYWYGKHHSEETKKKMASSKFGNHYAPTKSILQFSKYGEFIAEYPSFMEAERKTGISNSSICQCCKGKRKSAGGYIWKYKE